MRAHAINYEATRVEVAYFTAALVLSGLLWAVYRRGSAPVRGDAVGAGAAAG